MSRRDDAVNLQDMLSHSLEAVELLGHMTYEELKNNRVIQLALTRLVEIIGEAANRISAAKQKAPGDIPWPQIISMRNRLIHGYDVVDYELLHDTVTQDLPPLIKKLKRLLEE